MLQMVPASPNGGGYWSPLQPHVHAGMQFQHRGGPWMYPDMPPQVSQTSVKGHAHVQHVSDFTMI
jgi:hypothetical protein